AKEIARRAYVQAKQEEDEIADFQKVLDSPDPEAALGIKLTPEMVAYSKLDDAACENLPPSHPINLRSKRFAKSDGSDAAERLAQWEATQKPNETKTVLDELRDAGK